MAVLLRIQQSVNVAWKRSDQAVQHVADAEQQVRHARRLRDIDRMRFQAQSVELREHLAVAQGLLAALTAADVLGRAADLGGIQVGFTADLVAVRGDPLKDPHVLRSPVLVVKAGKVVRNLQEQRAPSH